MAGWVAASSLSAAVTGSAVAVLQLLSAGRGWVHVSVGTELLISLHVQISIWHACAVAEH